MMTQQYFDADLCSCQAVRMPFQWDSSGGANHDKLPQTGPMIGGKAAMASKEQEKSGLRKICSKTKQQVDEKDAL